MSDRDEWTHGVFDMDEATYLADPVPGGSLSHSGAKLILEAPAKYDHDKRNTTPKDSGAAMNLGSAAHCAVLNPQDVDALVAVGEFRDWRAKGAAAFKKEAVESGRAPVLAKQWAGALEMAKRVHDHPTAGAILETCQEREMSLFWSADGIEKRARLDFMGGRTKSGRYLCGDYKTANDASTQAFEKAIISYGYHSQAAFYTEGVSVLLGESDPGFVFIVQETDAPYLVNVVKLSAEHMTIGAERMKRAVDLFKQCSEADEWPGYGDEITNAIVPTWATYQHADLLASWGWDVAT